MSQNRLRAHCFPIEGFKVFSDWERPTFWGFSNTILSFGECALKLADIRIRASAFIMAWASSFFRAFIFEAAIKVISARYLIEVPVLRKD